jgi:hypothetical protein
MAIEFEVAEIVGAVESEIDDIARKTAFSVLTNVVLATPVGNPTLWKQPESAPPGYVGGHARRNWQVGLRAPKNDELPGVDKSGTTAIAKGRGTIDAYRKGKIYITNNVPYINRLNNGWSRQAPIGFVERSITRGVKLRGGRKRI